VGSSCEGAGKEGKKGHDPHFPPKRRKKGKRKEARRTNPPRLTSLKREFRAAGFSCPKGEKEKEEPDIFIFF